MSVKFPTKDSEMQSLYSLAWFGKSAGSAADPVFSGYHAAEADEVEEGATPEEAEVLAAALTVQAVREPSAAELEWQRNQKLREAEQVLQLVRLGATYL